MPPRVDARPPTTLPAELAYQQTALDSAAAGSTSARARRLLYLSAHEQGIKRIGGLLTATAAPTPVPQYSDLRVLVLSCNQLTKIEGVSGLTKLERIEVRNACV